MTMPLFNKFVDLQPATLLKKTKPEEVFVTSRRLLLITTRKEKMNEKE